MVTGYFFLSSYIPQIKNFELVTGQEFYLYKMECQFDRSK